ncbi:MAG: transglutaminase domain-containing protein [Candidatus Shapirobacteria bacterium]
MIVLVLLFLLLTSPTLATGEFSLSKSTSYHFDQAGLATVEETIDLQNNYSQIYPTQYSLSLTSTTLKNIIANDSSGNILQNTTTDSQTNTTVINLKFNHPGVGKDKNTTFQLRYQLDNLAKLKGNTWEISLPQIEPEVTQKSLKISIPRSFGPVAFASVPFTSQEKVDSQEISLTPQPKNKILITFGDYQLFNFNLTYELQNQQSSPSYLKIPLPPDTSHQRVIFSHLTPRPENISSDPDGNWLATYLLEPQSNLTVTTSGQVQTFSLVLEPTSPLPQHTQSQSLWPIDNPQIQTTIANFKTPKNIYDFVVSHLDYNYDLINNPSRKGALSALADPKNSLCTEFTDLFVTLARAKGIPAREIEGYALTNDSKIKPVNPVSDILHAWPQYFDFARKSWIDIDPTWAKTTAGVDYFSDIDLNHVTLVIHGLDSFNPPPPGSYRLTQNKTVDFSLAKTKIPATNLPPIINFTNSPQKKLFLTLSNPNLHSLKSVKITSQGWSWESPSLPPLSITNISPPQTSWLASLLPQNRQLNLTLEYGVNTTNLKLNYPRHFSNLFLLIGIAIVGLSIGGIILTTSHHDQKTG